MKTHPTTKLAEEIRVDIQLPDNFPQKYRAAVIRAAEQCKVKKHFEHPPIIKVTASLVTHTQPPN
jgi:ribosomal protein S12 methylthiotransferase accessory factor